MTCTEFLEMTGKDRTHMPTPSESFACVRHMESCKSCWDMVG